MPSEYFGTNIWMTTSGNFSVPAFQCAYDTFGSERIMFGTDYPMEDMIRKAFPSLYIQHGSRICSLTRRHNCIGLQIRCLALASA